VKFLVDAQLPLQLALMLRAAGHDAIHTRDLPLQNLTPDREINTISIEQERIVITKDRDFLDSFILQQQPYKLLLVTTGNIPNTQLLELFTQNLSQLCDLFTQHSLIELNRDDLLVHQ
jgi:predicted nuclease of predicted toxin-antitoxin system